MSSPLSLADFRVAKLTSLHSVTPTNSNNPSKGKARVLIFDPEVLESKFLPNLL